ncbi:hypothetical protein JNJ66_03280 [Candidatus Saccharibacteria bacterium]|nr:hypothetical protein [Candidatus Saccharibacteria bacterium]
MKTKTSSPRRNRSRNTSSVTAAVNQSDGAFLLKLVLYVILGSLWLRLAAPVEIGFVEIHSLPIGLAAGLLFAAHDHFQIDRKIEYVVLIVIGIVTFYLPAGIVL